jgi:hypothetical protein
VKIHSSDSAVLIYVNKSSRKLSKGQSNEKETYQWPLFNPENDFLITAIYATYKRLIHLHCSMQHTWKKSLTIHHQMSAQPGIQSVFQGHYAQTTAVCPRDKALKHSFRETQLSEVSIVASRFWRLAVFEVVTNVSETYIAKCWYLLQDRIISQTHNRYLLHRTTTDCKTDKDRVKRFSQKCVQICIHVYNYYCNLDTNISYAKLHIIRICGV